MDIVEVENITVGVFIKDWSQVDFICHQGTTLLQLIKIYLTSGNLIQSLV